MERADLRSHAHDRRFDAQGKVNIRADNNVEVSGEGDEVVDEGAVVDDTNSGERGNDLGNERSGNDDERIEKSRRVYGEDAFRGIQDDLTRDDDGYKRRRRDEPRRQSDDIASSSP